MKILKKIKFCQVLTVIYHLTFLGGTTTLVNGYLDEIRLLRTEIHNQAAKAEKIANDIQKTGQGLNNSLKGVKKACGKLIRF